MVDWTKWILGIAGVLICAAIIAGWKLISGKVDAVDLEKAILEFDQDIKAINLRIDQSVAVIAQAVSKTDLIDKMGAAANRADDKDVRVQRDIMELKGDLKALIEKVTSVDKRLDEIPARVASLELTRNQHKE